MKVARARRGLVAALAFPIALSLGGCIYSSTEKTTEKQVPSPMVYGDGKSVPYYWVWIPTGTTPPAPPAPPRVP
jgi:hypothetical protein